MASEYGLSPIYKEEFHQVFEEHQEHPEFKPLLERMKVVDSDGASAMDEDQWEAASALLFYFYCLYFLCWTSNANANLFLFSLVFRYLYCICFREALMIDNISNLPFVLRVQFFSNVILSTIQYLIYIYEFLQLPYAMIGFLKLLSMYSIMYTSVFARLRNGRCQRSLTILIKVCFCPRRAQIVRERQK